MLALLQCLLYTSSLSYTAKLIAKSMTYLRQLCSCLCFSVSPLLSSLKISLFWKIIFNSSHFGRAQFKKSCPVTTDRVKCSSAGTKLHVVTMTRRNKLALKFHLKRPLWSSSMWLKIALKTISPHTRLEYIKVLKVEP